MLWIIVASMLYRLVTAEIFFLSAPPEIEVITFEKEVILDLPKNQSESSHENIRVVANIVEEVPKVSISGDKSVSLFSEEGIVIQDVPFVAQAPLENWSDIRQQNACEETSVLMAMKWVEGRSISPEWAEQEILRIVDFEKETFGHFHDSSAGDTYERIVKEYYGHTSAFLEYDITV